jgi:hypothetical protein
MFYPVKWCVHPLHVYSSFRITTIVDASVFGMIFLCKYDVLSFSNVKWCGQNRKNTTAISTTRATHTATHTVMEARPAPDTALDTRMTSKQGMVFPTRPGVCVRGLDLLH